MKASLCVCARSIGEGDKWRKVIYPGMKQAIISVLQVSQDRVIDRKVLKLNYCITSLSIAHRIHLSYMELIL